MIVAVICHYWPNRRGNVDRIIADLRAGTTVPDRIVVLNNGPDTIAFDGADMIHAPWNSECRGKFVSALMIAADYYLLLDDDTSVGSRTLECLMRYARRDICTGYLGCWLDERNSFHRGPRLWPSEATTETECRAFCGCAMFMSFKSLVNVLILEERVRLRAFDGRMWPVEGDDIIAGFANRSTVVPMRDDECFVNIGHRDQAMEFSVPDYYEMRDRFVADVQTALTHFCMPEW